MIPIMIALTFVSLSGWLIYFVTSLFWDSTE